MGMADTAVVLWTRFLKHNPADPASSDPEVLPSTMRARVALEAGTALAWARYTGLDGATVGLDRFGASAPCHTIINSSGSPVAEAAHRVTANTSDLQPALICTKTERVME
jgi:transketolase